MSAPLLRLPSGPFDRLRSRPVPQPTRDVSTPWQRSPIIGAVLVACLLAAGCGRTEPVASNETTTSSTPDQPAATPAVTVATTVAAQPSSYVIQPGDSLGGIASAFGISQQALIDYNNLADPDRIAAGQQLLIPPGATSTTTTPTTAAPPPAETTPVETAPAIETTVAE